MSPAVLGLGLLAALHRRYSPCDLTCFFILVQTVILMAGGRYTYTETPLFEWLKVQLDLSRNYYDRLGHFFQGFTPAFIAREVLIRNGVLCKRGWRPFFVLATALAISACYEFLEWWVALATGEAADAFLGTQGDVWDTQWDMFLALIGTATALLFFSGAQDRFLARSDWPAPPPWPATA